MTRVANGKVKICLVSSSGGHWEQLQKLQPLVDKYDGFFVTEKTPFIKGNPYLMVQTDLKDGLMPLKMLVNGCRAIAIWAKERPDIVVTTGTMVAYPFYLLAVAFKKKFVFIETFGRSNEPTVAGRLMHKHADLFFVQWESQKRFYEKARYVGCLY
ncbi:PssD/Cps14F family polysaccharide biosynthesis glycosyltransferase [Gordonibacter pamelaeae]|uniref:PssD/Cps14F family polysaccharide biosynthesis glycosyltransferase n=1 Tax=Gordonibacter pamelaeae TaxID=471189 RepID=UPI003A8D7273